MKTLFDEKYEIYQLNKKRATYFDREHELAYILSHKKYYEDRLQDITDELDFIASHTNEDKYKAREQYLPQEAEHVIWCLLQFRRLKTIGKNVISKKEQQWIHEDVIERIEDKVRTQRRVQTVHEALQTALKHWDA